MIYLDESRSIAGTILRLTGQSICNQRMELIGRKIFYSSREKMLAQTRRQIVLVGVIVVSVYLVWMFVSV